jgi:alpha-tubulin suppressor-like RCC1 family protein
MLLPNQYNFIFSSHHYSIRPERKRKPQHLVLTCGINEDGQLGHGDKEPKFVPTVVPELENMHFISVACGWAHNFLLTDDHHLYSWGKAEYAIGHPGRRDKTIFFPTLCEMTEGMELTQVVTGRQHTLALNKRGDIFAWGKSEMGQLGQGNTDPSLFPVRITSLRDKGIVQIASGLDHCVALSSDHRVWTWGFAAEGQLGHGQTEDIHQPKELESMRGAKIKQIACGTDCTALVSGAGELFTFGNSEMGQLGHGQKGIVFEPLIVPMEDPVVSVACGGAHMLAITRNGQVWSWGWGEEGRLGLGDTTTYTQPTLVEPLADKKIISVSCGGGHSVAISEDNVYTWGFGAQGRLGHGDENNLFLPKAIEGIAGLKVVRGICGLDHTLLIIEKPSEEEMEKRFETNKK